MKFFKLQFILLICSFSACLPKEDLIEPTPRLNQTLFIDHGKLRNDIVFVSLELNEIVHTVSPFEFDFYGNERGIFLNGFKHMRAAILNEPLEDFQGNITEDSFKYLTMDYEEEQWLLNESTNYLIGLGIDEDGNSFGQLKFRYIALSNETYEITYQLEKPGQDVMKITTSERDFAYSVLKNQFVELPKENAYDLIFGRYTDFVTFVSISIDYIVSGAIQNYKTQAKLLDKTFDNVSIEDFTDTLFQTQSKREIGWDWKKYSIEKQAYEVESEKTYLIENQNGLKMKMRFVDFYNSVGISGHPTIEYVIL